MEGQTKDCHFVCLSPLSLIFPNTCLHLLCLVLFVLGYGWKRLDFDIFLEDRQSGLPPLQRFLHCSAEGSHPKRFSWTPCNHSTNLVVLSGSSLNQISQQIKLSLSLVLGLD